MNFKGFGDEAMTDVDFGGGVGGGGRLIPGMYDSLARQTSIYSLTFDELQNTIGGGAGTGKDFGSMNMDELLKNIWTAEEAQTMGGMVGSTPPSHGGVGVGGVVPGSGYLQRQGSLTLPRTLSQKTVDEVWRDMSKENEGVGASSASLAASFQQRQRTLGEMTLEEFLAKAGVVREDMQLTGQPNNVGFIGELSLSNNNALGLAFEEAGQSLGLMGNQIPDSTNQISLQSPNLPLNFNGVRTTIQQQLPQMQAQQVPATTAAAAQQMQHQLYPKQGAISAAYATPMPQLGSPKIRGGLVGFSDQGFQAAGMGISGLGAAGAVVTVPNASPALSSDGIVGKGHNGYASSVSPVPCVFSGVRGRKSGNIEKVVERRHRRMIKNRESAARSRARKQAYTLELETEVAKLKEENEALLKKQEDLMETQNNQAIELMNMQQGGKKRCLRRTRTGPW